jgi:hypothetical protein
MHEDIIAALALNETEPLAGIEPLHDSLFSQLCFLFLLLLLVKLSYLALLVGPSANSKKGLQVLTRSPSKSAKGSQEQQTQFHYSSLAENVERMTQPCVTNTPSPFDRGGRRSRLREI